MPGTPNPGLNRIARQCPEQADEGGILFLQKHGARSILRRGGHSLQGQSFRMLSFPR